MAIKFYFQPLHFEENEEIKTIVIQIKKLNEQQPNFKRNLLNPSAKCEDKCTLFLPQILRERMKMILPHYFFISFHHSLN